MHNHHTIKAIYTVGSLLKNRRKAVNNTNSHKTIHTVYTKVVSKKKGFIHVLST